ncbi:MAG TPA: hypothetical protein VMK12_07080 [Anaeromyxobacteraceae bacterium]|nr:hypothetical protein [Anaeromyxobacteraceae bacterium]
MEQDLCHIAHNGRGRPLVSRAVVISLIGSPATTSGYRAAPDDREYATGVEISDKEFAAIAIDFHGDWNCNHAWSI